MSAIYTEQHNGKTINIYHDDTAFNPFVDYDQCHEWFVEFDRDHKEHSTDFECPTLTRQQVKDNLADIVELFANVEYFNMFGKINEPAGTLLKGLSITLDSRDCYTDAIDYINDCIQDVWNYGYHDKSEILEWAGYAVVSGTHQGYSQSDWFDYIAYLSPAVIAAQGISKPTEYLEAVMQEYADYCFGNVHGYVITDKDGNEVGSCWGFFGDYDGYVLEEARSLC